MNRSLRGAILVLALSPTTAAADWRDYRGKTLIVEAKSTGRTVNDVITARGGASENDDVSNNDCDFTYHLYLSGKGRLFVHTTRIHCAGQEAYDYDDPSGTIYDLTGNSGLADMGSSSPAMPYSLSVEGDEVVIDMPQTDYVFRGDGYVSTISNARGSYAQRVRFATDCALSAQGESSFRMEYDSTTSDYYTLQDTQSTYGLSTVSCRVVDGFVAK